ncbi:MAG: response regulator [Candidatus Nitronauta litoralis]|uniref:Response regulator n=1 Tax=Candidatus Nitronauta litoralis TaxID=2705533 RepID=A0A7T0G100_9BACT|nr:MAG: response regulator [Candidatus Nitronauta litoralis]
MEGKPINVLLVEDDGIDVLNLKRALKKNNITNPLFVAGNGLEALDMLRGENGAKKIDLPRIILLDLNMPKMDGFEFLEQVRKDPELHTSIIYVMTTSSDQKDILKAHEFNIAGYIVKPLEFEVFRGIIKTLHESWGINEYP